MGWSSDEPRRIAEIDVEPAERGSEAVTGRLLIASARPVVKETAAALVGGSPFEGRPFALCKKLEREPVGADIAIVALHVDADASSGGQVARDRNQRDAARVRDVEIDPQGIRHEFRATANSALNRDLDGGYAERGPQQTTQCRAAGDPSAPQLIRTETGSAGMFGGRETGGKVSDLGVAVR
jgi:hypothetical protein